VFDNRIPDKIGSHVMDAALAQPVRRSGAGFRLVFIDGQGLRRQEPLASGWAVPFEHGYPIRSFPSRQGQRNFPGLWWSATTGEHVGFESWLEREHVMMLDFDPAMVAFSSQPFWLLWHDGKRPRRHAPDFFARQEDGSGLVMDVRADDQIPDADAEAFEATARACASVGWAYRRVGNPDPVLAGNVRWLAGYRHPRCADDQASAQLMNAFSKPAGLLDGVRAVGDTIALLPVAFHLLWTRALHADLASAPLSRTTLVTVVPSAS
jgi:hypothetical protein